MKPFECALYSTSIYANSSSEFNDITSEDLRDIFESTEEVEEEEGNPTQTSFEDDLAAAILLSLAEVPGELLCYQYVPVVMRVSFCLDNFDFQGNLGNPQFFWKNHAGYLRYEKVDTHPFFNYRELTSLM